MRAADFAWIGEAIGCLAVCRILQWRFSQTPQSQDLAAVRRRQEFCNFPHATDGFPLRSRH